MRTMSIAVSVADAGSIMLVPQSHRRPNTPGPLWPKIALRAYEIHESEGGDEMDNWLQAERELADGRYPGFA